MKGFAHRCHYMLTQFVRILLPPPVWIGTKPGHAKPQCFGDSRDSKNDSIFGLRPEIQAMQETCAELNTTTIRTHLVRILHLHYKTACFPWKNEGSGTTLATQWTTHQGARQRTRRYFPQGQHLQAWIGRKAKAIGPICKKPWENRVYQRRGQEPNFWEFSQCFWDV